MLRLKKPRQSEGRESVLLYLREICVYSCFSEHLINRNIYDVCVNDTLIITTSKLAIIVIPRDFFSSFQYCRLQKSTDCRTSCFVKYHAVTDRV